MKETDFVTMFIEEKVHKYCKQLSINKPKILTKSRQILDLPKDITRGRRTTAYKYLGVAYMSHNIVFLNLRRHKTRKSLEKTIRHELIHMRFPYLSHGDEFEKKIELLRKGHEWKPSKSKYLDQLLSWHP